MPILIALALAGAPAAAGRIALLPAAVTAVDPALVPTLTAVLGVELAHAGLEVTSAADIDSLLELQRGREELGIACDTDCALDIGDALGVDHILVTHIGMLGRTYVLDLTLIDIRQAKAIARIYETVRGPPERLLDLARASARSLAARLAAPAAHSHPTPALAAEPEPSYALPGWITAIAGAATLAAGTGLHIAGANDEPVRITGDVLIGLGAAATLAGLFTVGLSWGGDVGITPTDGGAMARWGFGF